MVQVLGEHWLISMKAKATSKDTMSIQAIDNLNHFKLSQSTKGGVDGYLQVFEQGVQDLEEAGHHIDDMMKKLMLLQNVVDIDYNTVIKILKDNSNKTYEDAILALRSKGRQQARGESHLQQGPTVICT
jgi:hypothetical protein